MKKLKLWDGLWMGAYLLLIQLIMAEGTYLTSCLLYKHGSCSLSNGFTWIKHHPVFPNFILFFPILAFIVGAFGELILSIMPIWVKKIFDPSSMILLWVLVGFLVLAFALWGLPDAIHILKMSR